MAARVLAVLAALLCVGVLVATFAIWRNQDASPAWWFVALLVVAIAGLGYGVTSGARHGPVLIAASALVSMLGVLAIFSVGLLLLAAGALGFVASALIGVRARGAAAP
ncbi:MAG: hypothetical protein ACXWYO_08530 [Gaiellaceae bacterium]